MTGDVVITKENGERELFDRSKLEHSLRRSGAKEDYVQEVVDEIEKKLKPGMRTSKIYGKAFSILEKKQKIAAVSYSLQRAVLSLGPTGYPFEYFVKEVFDSTGYSTLVRKHINGNCVVHEIDVVACKEDECLGVEVKFHNDVGIKSDLQTALYVKARFEDIKIACEKGESGLERPITQGALVTNTKFSSTAIKYAECVGLQLLGWNYPREKNLQDAIEEAGVHPLTALTTLSKKDKRKLLMDDVVLCRSVKNNPDVLKKYGISDKKANKTLEEIDALISS